LHRADSLRRPVRAQVYRHSSPVWGVLLAWAVAPLGEDLYPLVATARDALQRSGQLPALVRVRARREPWLLCSLLAYVYVASYCSYCAYCFDPSDFTCCSTALHHAAA
jgi:hypothetical protein